jgi:hypothetical protein
MLEKYNVQVSIAMTNNNSFIFASPPLSMLHPTP